MTKLKLNELNSKNRKADVKEVYPPNCISGFFSKYYATTFYYCDFVPNIPFFLEKYMIDLSEKRKYY